MAALRNAARRLGGSVLQRTQAAVASPAVPEGQRGLFLPRLCSTVSQDPPTRQIQEMKEELYDMLSTQKKLAFSDGRLMHNLSVQIKPRPHDLRWKGFQIRKRLDNVVDAVVFSTLSLLLLGFWLSLNESSAEDGKEEALGVKNKQD